MAHEEIMERLKPCPFCGSTDINIGLSSGGKIVIRYADHAEIKCLNCGCQFKYIMHLPEHFEHIKDDLYRMIPIKYAEEVMIEKWNSRVGEIEE